MNKFGEEITFLANDSVSTHLAARLIDPHGIDYKRIEYWLKLCEQSHDVCPQISTIQPQQKENLLPYLRVVDVQNMCLTEIPWSERYVTLSYLWGGATPPRLLRDELEMWKTAGSI